MIRGLICEWLCIQELAELYTHEHTHEFIPHTLWVKYFEQEFPELHEEYNLDFNPMFARGGYSDDVITIALMTGYDIHRCLIRDEYNYYLYMRLKHPTLPADYASHHSARYRAQESGYTLDCGCDTT